MSELDSMVSYAMCMVGLPYRWGGDDAILGFDCSGLVQEILASYGEDPAGDQTAHRLYEYFTTHGKLCSPQKGALSFYGSTEKIIHVGFCIDAIAMIEAGGGNSGCNTRNDAARMNAFVRVRPTTGRNDWTACIMPNYRFMKS